MNHLLLSPYLADTLETPSKWIFIGLFACLILTILIAFLVNKFGALKVVKVAVAVIVLLAIAFGIFLLVAEIFKKYDLAYLTDNYVNDKVIPLVFIPLLTTLCLALIGGIVLFILSKKSAKTFKKTALIIGIVLGVAIITTLILMGVYHSKYIVGDGYYTDENYGKLNSLALYISAIVIVCVLVLVAFTLGKKDKKPFDTHCIALAGVCVALSFALSYVKLWDMPTGGSVTLVSLLPVMLFAFIYGTKKGLLVGLLYGVLQAIQDPWLIHPAQFILDYPIAFSCVCLAGVFSDLNLFKKLPQVRFALSAVIAGAFRFICHVLSGVFAFGAYAVDAGAESFWTYSLIYNSYVFIDIALVIVVGTILLSSKAFVKEIEKNSIINNEDNSATK